MDGDRFYDFWKCLWGEIQSAEGAGNPKGCHEGLLGILPDVQTPVL